MGGPSRRVSRVILAEAFVLSGGQGVGSGRMWNRTLSRSKLGGGDISTSK